MWPYTDKPLRLALVGMSGSGKSYWTRRIASVGFPSISCDSRIEERLKPLLQAGGYAGINGVAAWMGWPDQPAYTERESAYLTEEIATLDVALSSLEKNPHQDLVLDTTGSVIYVGNHLLHRLRKQMLVVYLAASPDEQQLLIRRYLEDPKPVLWRGAFQPKADEAPRDTVARCYPALIASRRQSYESLAHLSIPVAALRDPSSQAGISGNAEGHWFLAQVRLQLDRAGKLSKTDPVR